LLKSKIAIRALLTCLGEICLLVNQRKRILLTSWAKGEALLRIALLVPLVGLAGMITNPAFGTPWIDPQFSPSQRMEILNSLDRLPKCQKSKTENLRFQYDSKIDGSLSECTEGYYPGNATILLYPSCNFGAAIVIHEVFHHLGYFNKLNSIWKSRVLKEIPDCPVSDYAAEGLGSNNEDLAETGRLLLVPESSSDRNPGSCVDAKIARLRQLLACPN
jgi:hypothetical protein